MVFWRITYTTRRGTTTAWRRSLVELEALGDWVAMLGGTIDDMGIVEVRL